MAVVLKTNTRGFDQAMRDLVDGLKKEAGTEMKRQAKLLALAIASAASPRPKGLKGLAAGIPKAKAKAWLKVVKRLVKPAYSMRILDVARRNDADTLFGIARTTTRNPLMKTSAINRIVMAARRDVYRAMINLRQILKGKLSNGEAGNAEVYQELNGAAMAQYYRLLDRMGKDGLKSIPMSARIYLRQPIKDERKKIMDAYIPTIGTVKAGWVQAAMAIPSKAGRKPPNWLLNKKVIGSGSVSGDGMKMTITIRNAKGNAKGMDERTDYVRKAIRFRIHKMYAGLKGAIARKLAQKYRRLGQPVPAHLQFANRPNDNDFEVEI